MINKWVVLLLLIVLAASHGAAYKYGEAHRELVAQVDVSTQTATNAVAQTKLVVGERQTEQAAQLAVNEVSQSAVLEQNDISVSLVVANSTVDRLQRELQATRDNLRGTGSYASLAERSASATKAAMVLSELYGSCQRRVVELAGAYDQAYSRGMICSTSYDKVSKVFKDDG